jgi:predicted PurR-regulated permease PerM
MNYIGEGIGVIFNVGITLSSAFFISLDYPRIKEVIKDLIPDIIKKEVIYFFSRYLPFFSKYMYALFIDSLITFAVSFLLFFIFGVDYSLICAFIVTITNLIPYIGPILGVIPLVIIGYSVSPYFAIVSLVIVLVVQIFESNLIQPLIFKNVIKIHPLEGIIGLLVFSYLFSIIGMIASPLLVVAFKLLFIEKYKPESHIETKSIQ